MPLTEVPYIFPPDEASHHDIVLPAEVAFRLVETPGQTKEGITETDVGGFIVLIDIVILRHEVELQAPDAITK